MTKTAIEWTDEVWNPVTGCSKVSQGCKHCYAERVFPRPYPGRAFTDVRTHPDRLDALSNAGREDSDLPAALDWVVSGGESGPHARPTHPDWLRALRDDCDAAGVPFFFKQWGEWRGPAESEVFDTSMGRAQKVPAFIVAQDGTVHCFKNERTRDGGHYRAAFFTSFGIGVGNILLFKLAPEATGIEIAAFLLGGPLGIISSMLFHRRFVGKKTTETPAP